MRRHTIETVHRSPCASPLAVPASGGQAAVWLECAAVTRGRQFKTRSVTLFKEISADAKSACWTEGAPGRVRTPAAQPRNIASLLIAGHVAVARRPSRQRERRLARRSRLADHHHRFCCRRRYWMRDAGRRNPAAAGRSTAFRPYGPPSKQWKESASTPSTRSRWVPSAAVYGDRPSSARKALRTLRRTGDHGTGWSL